MKLRADFLEALNKGAIELPAAPAKKKGEAGQPTPASPPPARPSPPPKAVVPKGEERKLAPAAQAAAPQLRSEPRDPPTAIQVPPLPSEPPAEDRAPLAELIQHCAVDSIFYCKKFFPKTFRQESPPFHADIWTILDDPSARYVNIQVMRDGAKTTLLRGFASKRIAYGISRTILYIGASQDKAKQSVGWLKTQILKNKEWTEVFKLERARPFSDEHIVIKHTVEDHVVHVLAYGVTGSTRGVNLDDWRPDLIIVDDVLNDENAATIESRAKIKNLVLGAIKESLSPASESPDAKMVLLNTPQDFEDLSTECLKDPQFVSARFGCWTAETEELAIELQESSWPIRYPSEVLRKEKRAAISRNTLSIFAREKEVRLVTPETSAFREAWLRYFGFGEEEPEPPRDELWIEYAIDPVPPPSDAAIAKGLKKNDFEAHAIVGRRRGKYYLLELVANRGHDPSWTSATFFELASRWAPRKVLVESVAYQRTLTWLLKEAMKRAGRYWVVEPFDDKRRKIDRILQGVKGVAANEQLYVRRTQTGFISQYIHYPGKNPDGTHDDELEATAVALTSLQSGHVGNVSEDQYRGREQDFEALEDYRGAP
jgi:phage terminase large subunit-like protein